MLAKDFMVDYDDAGSIGKRYRRQDEIGTPFCIDVYKRQGLRGVIGAGTNRMNIYVVRQATQGLANYIIQKYGKGSVAISHDSSCLLYTSRCV